MKYKIVGFGNKLSNISPISNYSTFLNSIKDYGLVYINNDEEKRMSIFFSGYEYRSKITKLMKLQTYTNLNYKFSNDSQFTKFNNYYFYNSNLTPLTKNGTGPSFGVFNGYKPYIMDKYNNLYFNVVIQNLKVEIDVFLIIGILLVLLGFLFINFMIKREITQSKKTTKYIKKFWL